MAAAPRLLRARRDAVTLGNVLSGQQAIRDFYGFFHKYVREHIDLIKYYPTEGGFWVHVAMRLDAFDDLSPEVLAANGIARMPAIPKGTVYENEMFIHYEVENDRLKLLRCAEYIPPQG